MPMLLYSRPVIPLLIPWMVGIGAGTLFPGFDLWFVILTIVIAVWLCVVLKKKKTAVFSPLCLFTALGYLAIQFWVVPRFPDNHVIHFAGTRSFNITGTIHTPPLVNRNRLQFVMDTQTLVDPKTDTTHTVVGYIQLTVYMDSYGKEKLRLAVGDLITVKGRIKTLRNFHNPNGFNYERHMAFQRIWTSASTQSKRLKIHASQSKTGLKIIIERMRSHIAGFIHSSDVLVGGQREKDVLRALMIGDQSGISPVLRDSFNRTGIGHLLAISGLHVGIVATVAFFIFQWIFSFIPLLLWRGGVKKWAGIFTLIPVIIYGLIAGMSPSTQRAVIMVTVFLMTFVIEREHDLINTLAMAAMVILVVHPPALFSISFQLSFISVFFIVYGLSRLPKSWTVVAETAQASWFVQKGKRLISFIFVSVFATLGTLPLVMTYFNQVSLIGVFSNCIMVPLVGFFVVPLSLFSVILYPVWTFGAEVVLQISAVILFIALSIAQWLSDFSFAAIKTMTPSLLETCCFYLLTWAAFNIRRVPSNNQDIPEPFLALNPLNKFNTEKSTLGFPKLLWHFLRTRMSFAGILALLVIAVFCADGCYWLKKRFWQSDFRVTVIDVGQGSSALLELPGGRCFLLDGGGFSDNTAFDVGERIVAPLLWGKKIMTVDTLILTHPNSDHLNGLLYIARHFHVNTIWMNNDITDTLGYQQLMGLIESEKIHRPDFNTLSRFQTIDGVTFHILNPSVESGVQYPGGNRKNLDNNSIVLKISFGGSSFLFTGDIMAKAESQLISRYGDELKSTVLIAPHHGSKTSSTMPFLKRAAPQVVIIPAGWQNRFGFPHPLVIERYNTMGFSVYTTGENGAIVLSTYGHNMDIIPMIPNS